MMLHMFRTTASTAVNLAVRTEAQFFRTKPGLKEEVLRPLSVTLIISHPFQDNKIFYGALVKNTVNT